MPSADEIRDRFLSLLQRGLDLENYGFTDITPFVDQTPGLAFQKNTTGVPNHTSLFHIFISQRDLLNEELRRKPLIVTVVYGEKVGGGVRMRGAESDWLNEPLDLTFYSEFSYDPIDDQIYKENARITAQDLLDEVFEKHLRNTDNIRGFFLRLRLALWRIWLPFIFEYLSGACRDLLYILTGDWYTYLYILREERLNGRVIRSRYPERIDRVDSPSQPESHETKAQEFDLFGTGIKVRLHPAMFYCLTQVILLLVLIFVYHINLADIENFLGSNFFTVIYALLSYSVVGILIPGILKIGVKGLAMLAAFSKYRNLKI